MEENANRDLVLSLAVRVAIVLAETNPSAEVQKVRSTNEWLECRAVSECELRLTWFPR